MNDSIYNYDRFSMRLFDVEHFHGPRAGEFFPDFELASIDGVKVDLASLKGRSVVIESGSITCPMYAMRIAAAARLQQRFADVEFLLLYVREAHPGERMGAHVDDEAKRVAAALTAELGETRTVLVDDLDGRLHRQIGSYPNLVYIIAPDGRVAHRQDWSNPRLIAEVLSDQERATNPKDRHGIAFPGPIMLKRTTLRGGWIAVWDIVINLPQLLGAHIGAFFSDRYPAAAAEEVL